MLKHLTFDQHNTVQCESRALIVRLRLLRVHKQTNITNDNQEESKHFDRLLNAYDTSVKGKCAHILQQQPRLRMGEIEREEDTDPRLVTMTKKSNTSKIIFSQVGYR